MAVFYFISVPGANRVADVSSSLFSCPNIPPQYAQFLTATILEWKPLLAEDALKDIIIRSLQFLVKDGRIKLYGFVIMPDPIHLIWQIHYKYERAKVQQSF